MTKFNCLPKKIANLLIEEFSLGEGDIFGIDILFNNMYYDNSDKKIKPNPTMNNILDEFYRINHIRPYTIWYPHYIKRIDHTNGIPVFINYKDISKYTLNKLKDKNIIENKIELLGPYVKTEAAKANQFDLTLNRKLENPFNEFSGSYEKDYTIELEALNDIFDKTYEKKHR